MPVLEPGNVGTHGICRALGSISSAEHGVCAQKPRLVAPEVVLDAQEGGGRTGDWCCLCCLAPGEISGPCSAPASLQADK